MPSPPNSPRLPRDAQKARSSQPGHGRHEGAFGASPSAVAKVMLADPVTQHGLMTPVAPDAPKKSNHVATTGVAGGLRKRPSAKQSAYRKTITEREPKGITLNVGFAKEGGEIAQSSNPAARSRKLKRAETQFITANKASAAKSSSSSSHGLASAWRGKLSKPKEDLAGVSTWSAVTARGEMDDMAAGAGGGVKARASTGGHLKRSRQSEKDPAGKVEQESDDGEWEDTNGKDEGSGELSTGPSLLEEWLFDLPIFKDCSRPFVEACFRGHRRYIFKPGQYIVRAGDQAHSMFVVCWGFADVTSGSDRDRDGGESAEVISTLGQGDCFGEIALLGVACKRTANIRACSHCGLLEVVSVELQRAFEEFPSDGHGIRDLAQSRWNAQHGTVPKHCPLFRGVSDMFKGFIERHVVERCVFAGDMVFGPHEEGLSMCAVMQGSVRVSIMGRPVHEIACGAQLAPGANADDDWMSHELEDMPPVVFGELSILGIKSLKAMRIHALTTCDVRVLSASQLRRAMEEFPQDMSLLEARAAAVMEHDSPANLLSIDSFSRCSAEYLELLAAHLEEMVYSKDKEVTIADDWASVFCVRFGAVEALIEGNQSPQMLPNSVFFGELQNMAISLCHVAHVHTKDISCIQVLHQSVILKALARFPSDRGALLEAAGNRFQEVDDQKGNNEGGVAALWLAPLFQGCPLEVVETIAKHSEKHVFLPGDDIIRQNDVGDSMFVLAEGTAVATIQPEDHHCRPAQKTRQSVVVPRKSIASPRQTKRGTVAAGPVGRRTRGSVWSEAAASREAADNPGLEGPEELVVHELSPGSTFGELALLGISMVRTATIRATSVALVWSIERPTVQSMLSNYPSEKMKFVTLINSHLERSVAKRMAGLSLLSKCDKRISMILGLHCERRVYFTGQKIVHENFPGDSMYLVNHGMVAVEVRGEAITALSPGKHFGDSVMLGLDRAYFATYSANTVCQVLVISRASFNAAVHKYPGMNEKTVMDALRAKVIQKTEFTKQRYSRAYTRKRLVRRIHFMPRRQSTGMAGLADTKKWGGVLEDMAEQKLREDRERRESTLSVLSRTFHAWCDRVKRVMETRSAREAEIAQSRTRMRDWVARKQAAMARIKPAHELKELIRHNMDSRGPLEVWRPKEGEIHVLEKQQDTTDLEVLIESWPKPRSSPHYSLKLWNVLRGRLTVQQAYQVQQAHQLGPESGDSQYAASDTCPDQTLERKSVTPRLPAVSSGVA